MEAALNNVLKSRGGFVAVFISLFANRVAPKLPPRLYRIIDHPFIQVFSITFLINTQLQSPGLSFAFAAITLYTLKWLVAKYAPETPPLSGLAKPLATPPSAKPGEAKTADGGSCPPCHCICNSVVRPF